MRKKFLASLCMAMAVLFSTNLPVLAANPGAIESKNVGSNIVPFWTNTDQVKVALTFSGSRADCSAIIDGKDGTTKITATATLQRVSSDGTRTTVKAWTGLETADQSFYFDESYYVVSDYTYRLTINAKVYKGSSYENISVYDEKMH